MHVISNKRLVDFAALHPDARVPLKAWRKLAESKDFMHFADLKTVFGSVDRVGKLTVFDIGGNRFRLIAAIHFDRHVVYVRRVFTHAEYDRGTPP